MSFKQLFPGKPTFTTSSIPSQIDKIFLVTGASDGVGFELASILYSKHATVYLAARSISKLESAISSIRSTHPSSTGSLHALVLDLADLRTVKPAVDEFAKRETKLHVLWNNAGIGAQPNPSVSQQGVELHIGVNCLAPFLLTQLLLPYLRAAALSPSSPAASVRVVWTGSGVIEGMSPAGGVSLDEISCTVANGTRNYAASKAGNWLLASELARRVGHGHGGIVSVCQNPGNLRTKIWLSTPRWLQFMVSPVLHPPAWGALTEAWAGLSEEVKGEDGGRYAIPWGRWYEMKGRADIHASLRSKSEGGTGVAEAFWAWCEEKAAEFR